MQDFTSIYHTGWEMRLVNNVVLDIGITFGITIAKFQKQDGGDCRTMCHWNCGQLFFQKITSLLLKVKKIYILCGFTAELNETTGIQF